MARERLSEILRRILEDTEGRTVTLGEIRSALGSHTQGPLLVLLGLLTISPIGAIPGASITLGSAVALVSIQMLIFRRGVWLPGVLAQREVGRERLERAVAKMRPWASWVERWLRPRLEPLTGSIANACVAVLCILLGASMWPLALVPFGVSPVGLAITLLGVGLITGDGVVVAVGLTIAVASGVLLLWVLPGLPL